MDFQDKRAVIFSLAGTQLDTAERELFAQTRPLGFILFARNCENPAQIRRLTDDLKSLMGWNCPILIDQEGGRVQRLKPPVWRQYPPMRQFGELAERDIDAALEDLRFTLLRLAEELQEVGINVNCAPVLDVLLPETHPAIGDRAFAADPALVGRLGVSVCRSLLAAGIIPVIKHMPGQGRAPLDSHLELPRVEVTASELDLLDFEPFRIVLKSDISKGLWGMLSHVIYTAHDSQHPASVSGKIIESVIRQQIGFDGFLVSDDLDMQALAPYGNIAQRAQACLTAGCDAALYCHGDLSVMQVLAESVPNLSQKAQERLQKTFAFARLSA